MPVGIHELRDIKALVRYAREELGSSEVIVHGQSMGAQATAIYASNVTPGTVEAADLDDDSQAIMSAWYNKLNHAGFSGTQPPDLPYHISMASFPLEQEQEVIELAKKVAGEFSPISVHISHIGIFSPGKVLFGAPERSTELDLLHNACEANPDSQRPWTPHVTLLIDEPSTICEALPLVLESFNPFVGQIIRLHLCAFWPTREILSIKLNRDR